jgi:hypothetical protein
MASVILPAMKRALIAVGAGIIYILVYCLLALLFVPIDFPSGYETRTTLVFLVPIFTLPLVFVAFVLTNCFANNVCRISFVLLLLIHYAITLALIQNYLRSESWTILLGVIELHQMETVFVIGWYILGQGILWYRFYRSIRPSKTLQ